MGELDGAPPPEMTYTIAASDAGPATVTVRGELDMSNIEELEQAVAGLFERKPDHLIVDVAALRFADSSAIALWVQWATSVDRFELRDPPPLLRRVIAGMGLSQKLAVEP